MVISPFASARNPHSCRRVARHEAHRLQGRLRTPRVEARRHPPRQPTRRRPRESQARPPRFLAQGRFLLRPRLLWRQHGTLVPYSRAVHTYALCMGCSAPQPMFRLVARLRCSQVQEPLGLSVNIWGKTNTEALYPIFTPFIGSVGTLLNLGATNRLVTAFCRSATVANIAVPHRGFPQVSAVQRHPRSPPPCPHFRYGRLHHQRLPLQSHQAIFIRARPQLLWQQQSRVGFLVNSARAAMMCVQVVD